MGVLGRQQHRLGTVTKSAGGERTYVAALEEEDEVLVEYNSDSRDPSRIVIEDGEGDVVFEEEVTSRESVTFEIEDPDEYAIRIEWGARARIEVYATTETDEINVTIIDDDGSTWSRTVS